jgi:hypothetical protein
MHDTTKFTRAKITVTTLDGTKYEIDGDLDIATDIRDEMRKADGVLDFAVEDRRWGNEMQTVLLPVRNVASVCVSPAF